MLDELRNIAAVQMGHSFRSRLEQVPGGNVAVIQMKDLGDDNRLDGRNLALTEMPEVKEHHRIRQNDLIFRSRGMTNTAVLVDRELKRAVVAAPLLRVRVNNATVLPGYLCWFINLPASQAFLQSHATGTTMRMIGKKTLDALDVQIPNLKTQQRIIELSRLADKERLLHTRLAQRQRQLVDGILMRAVSTSQCRDQPLTGE